MSLYEDEMHETATESTPLPLSIKKRKTGKRAVTTRWVWTNEMVGHLLRCLCDIKSQYEYKGGLSGGLCESI